MRSTVGVLLAILDAGCILLGLIAGWRFWLWISPNLQRMVQVRFAELWFPNPWMPAAVVFLVAWIFTLNRVGLHDPGRMANSARIASGISKSVALMGVITVLINFFYADRVYAKGLVVPFLGFTWLFLLSSRLLVFQLLLKLEKPPTASNAIIVGVEEDGAGMAERIARDARHVCSVVGFLRTRNCGPPAVPDERILGDVSDFASVVNKHDIRVVILATRTIPREDALNLAVRADRMGLRMLQAPFSWGAVSPRLGFARIGDLDLIDMVGIAYPTLAEQVKRLFDLTAVLLGGLCILPFLLVVALIIKVQDGGPVFYIGKRVGRGGRTFGFYKFRSMVVNADKLRAELQKYNESDGRLFKMKNDPRITPFGHFIRKYSIDEFPQLINVIRGDMNLVGPRALPASDLQGVESDPEMRYWFEQRSKVVPGITGLWQVKGRSSLGFAEMVRLDIQYIQNWSLWLDLQILVLTIPAVLKGRGSY